MADRATPVAAALTLAVALSALPTQPATAQRPGAERGRFEVPGMDWAPNSAWRPRAEVVRRNRDALLRRGDLRGLNGPGPFLARSAAGTGASAVAVTGSFFVPVIAIQYKDVDVAFPVADFRDVLFAPTPPQARPYTLKSYYEQVSGGRISMSGRVFEAVRTDSTATYYQQNCNGIGVLTACPDGGRRFGLMLLAVLDSISNRPGGDTVWSEFDNDGPDGIPNSGDDDGEVDFVTFLQPVKDGACSGSPGVWAHRWVISAWNNGSRYVTKTPRRNAQGQPIPGQFIRVNNYTIQSQVGGPGGCTDPPAGPFPASYIMPIGTVAHETGHAFGLPDLYDTDRSGSGTEGIGEWGIMGSGNYARAYSPASYDPWSLNELGWVTIEELTATRPLVRTGARQTSDTVFLARTNSQNELLLIENRQAVNSDTAMLNPNTPLPPPGTVCRSNCRKMPGLLLWHIDLPRIQAGRSSNTVNTGPLQGVAVVQADGLNQLRSNGANRNRGDDGDPFPGTSLNTAYTLQSVPAARLNTGEYTGFIIDQIVQLPSGEMTFRFLRREPSVVRSGHPGASVRVNGTPWGRFEDVLPAGVQFTISADTVQFTAGGRTVARFLNWSNGGARTQTVTSGATPDTITAAFTASHRVFVTTSGTGTGAVTASVAGDLAAGAFFPQGTPVTVTATPAAGVVFGGWRGDTTATSAAIALVIGRPYDLEATFVSEVAVAIADATADVLGTPKLSGEQKSFLDLLGNRNGIFDVGDYLALLRRNGQAVSPAVMQAAAQAARPGKGN